MEKFINRENIKIFKQRLEAPADEAQRQTLLKLLADEEAKSQQLNKGHEPKKRSEATDQAKLSCCCRARRTGPAAKLI